MTFRKGWIGIITDPTITESQVRNWLAAIPHRWQFVLDTNPAGKYTIEEFWQNGQLCPYPKRSYTFTIYSATNPAYLNNSFGGCSIPERSNFCVSYAEGDSDREMGARVWHELLHASGVDSDTLKSSHFADFSAYLRMTDSVFKDFEQYPDKYDVGSGHAELLLLFYQYLTDLYFPEVSWLQRIIKYLQGFI